MRVQEASGEFVFCFGDTHIPVPSEAGWQAFTVFIECIFQQLYQGTMPAQVTAGSLTVSYETAAAHLH